MKKARGVNMSQDGISKIKAKLQELADVIKQETVEETTEIKKEILEGVNEMKSKVEGGLNKAEQFGDKLGDQIGDNIEDFIVDLEKNALKIQYTIQEKYSQGIAQKDGLVNNAADSLIEAINKVKSSLSSKE